MLQWLQNPFQSSPHVCVGSAQYELCKRGAVRLLLLSAVCIMQDWSAHQLLVSLWKFILCTKLCVLDLRHGARILMCPSHPARQRSVRLIMETRLVVLENRLKQTEEVLVMERLAQRFAESAQQMVGTQSAGIENSPWSKGSCRREGNWWTRRGVEKVAWAVKLGASPCTCGVWSSGVVLERSNRWWLGCCETWQQRREILQSLTRWTWWKGRHDSDTTVLRGCSDLQKKGIPGGSIESPTQTCARVLREKLGREVDSKSVASSRARQTGGAQSVREAWWWTQHEIASKGPGMWWSVGTGRWDDGSRSCVLWCGRAGVSMGQESMPGSHGREGRGLRGCNSWNWVLSADPGACEEWSVAARWIYHAHECALGYRRTNSGVDDGNQKKACHRFPHPRRDARRPSVFHDFTASNNEVSKEASTADESKRGRWKPSRSKSCEGFTKSIPHQQEVRVRVESMEMPVAWTSKKQKTQIQMTPKEYEETRCVICQNGQKSSKRILWVIVSQKTETLPVLLINYLQSRELKWYRASIVSSSASRRTKVATSSWGPR